MMLARPIPGHRWTDSTTLAWLADAAIDVSRFPASPQPVGFSARLLVADGATAVVELRTGGLAQETGSTTIAAVTQHGPFHGTVAGELVADVDPAVGTLLLHLCAATSDAGLPIEIDDFRLTVGPDA